MSSCSFSGLLLIAAVAVALAVPLVSLCRSRRRCDSLPRRRAPGRRSLSLGGDESAMRCVARGLWDGMISHERDVRAGGVSREWQVSAGGEGDGAEGVPQGGGGGVRRFQVAAKRWEDEGERAPSSEVRDLRVGVEEEESDDEPFFDDDDD